MGMFTKSDNTMAYLKAGIYGFAGSGKSFTTAKIAIGLHKLIKSKKPIFYLDTETGSSFLIPMFKENNIELYTNKSRAFVDLLSAVDEAEKEQAILIIDSISHFWQELMDSFKQKKNLNRILMHHWMEIKPEWGRFSTKFINSKCHILMCGRAGWEYSFEKDDEGVNELIKTGTKMKSETELGYEPSLLVEMEKVKKNTQSKIGGNFLHRAWVLKDRFDVINGKYFDNPGFESFIPHIERLNLGGDHVAVDMTRDSKEMFNTDNSVAYKLKQRDIFIEELWEEMPLHFNTRTDIGKKEGAKFLKEVFGTLSKTAISSMPNEEIKQGLDKLKALPLLTEGEK